MIKIGFIGIFALAVLSACLNGLFGGTLVAESDRFAATTLNTEPPSSDKSSSSGQTLAEPQATAPNPPRLFSDANANQSASTAVSSVEGPEAQMTVYILAALVLSVVSLSRERRKSEH